MNTIENTHIPSSEGDKGTSPVPDLPILETIPAMNAEFQAIQKETQVNLNHLDNSIQSGSGTAGFIGVPEKFIMPSNDTMIYTLDDAIAQVKKNTSKKEGTKTDTRVGTDTESGTKTDVVSDIVVPDQTQTVDAIEKKPDQNILPETNPQKTDMNIPDATISDKTSDISTDVTKHKGDSNTDEKNTKDTIQTDQGVISDPDKSNSSVVKTDQESLPKQDINPNSTALEKNQPDTKVTETASPENQQNVAQQIDEKTEKQKEYLLSPEDYGTYFEGDNFEQANLGDCYLLAAIDSYMSWGMAESVTRKSVQLEKNQDGTVQSFHFFLPLGAPTNQAKEYTVSKEMIEKYKNHDVKLAKSGIKEGLLALMIAYGQISTGKTDFDPKLLNAGLPSKVKNTLIFGINTYFISRSRQSQESFLQGLDYVVKSFDKKTDMLSFATDMSSLQISKNWTEKMRRTYPQVWKQGDYNGHAFAVDNVYTDADGKTFISFSNPWDAAASITMEFEDFSKLVGQYYFSSTRTTEELADSQVNRILLEQGYSNENDIGQRQSINETGMTTIGDVQEMKQIQPVKIEVPTTPADWKQDEKFGEQYQEWELPNNVHIRKFDSGRIERHSPDYFEVVRRDGATFRGRPLKNQINQYEGVYTKKSGDKLEGIFDEDGRLIRGRRMVLLTTGRTQLEVGKFNSATENLALGERNVFFTNGQTGIRKGEFDPNTMKEKIIWGAEILGNRTNYLSNGKYVGWPSKEMRTVRAQVQSMDGELNQIKTEVDNLDTSLRTA